MQHAITTEIQIAATPDAVWRHLVDLDGYADWNPFITSASGSPAVGQRLTLRMEPPEGRAMTFRPTVTELAQGHVLEWLGHLGPRGVFDGRHRFELTATATGTKVVQRESFDGILVRFMRRSLDRSTKAGFDAMNTALARRAAASPVAG